MAAMTYHAPSRSPSRKLSQRQCDSAHRLDGRGCGPGDDVDVRAGRDQERKAALRDGAAADDHDLLAGQSQADEVAFSVVNCSLAFAVTRRA